MGKLNCPPLTCGRDSVSVCGLSVDNSTHNLIKTDVNRVVATLPSASTHAQIGRLYSTILSFDNTSDLLRQILFNNTSNQTMYLDKIISSCVVTFPLNTPLNYVPSVTIVIIKNVGIVDPGAPVTPTNLNTAFTDASSLSVSTNPNAIGGTAIFGMRTAGEFVTFDFDGRIVVPPNTNLIIQYLLHQPEDTFFLEFWSTITWYEL